MMRPKILLVEDDKALQQLIVYNFTKEGFSINTVNDGDLTLTAIKETQPDIILLDWMLPNVSGIELIRQIKSGKKTKSIPVIMLTAKGEETDRLRAFDLGADDYVSKPFSTAELIARTKAVINRTSSTGKMHSISYHDINLNK